MAVKFTNNAATTLAAGINNSVTSIAVTDGSVFPTITGSDYFYATFDDGTNKEIVKVTARSSNTLTVVRGQDSTSARAFSSGDKAELRIVAALLADVIAGVGSSALNVDTFSGNGSATAFTLSTTPAGEDNLIVFIEGVYQNPGDFTLSGTTLTFDVAPANSRNIIVYHVAALVSGNNLTHNQFTCNGSTTAFTLSLAPIHENNTQVFLNGVYQHKNTYTVSGTTLTLDTAPTNGVILEVMSFTQTDVNTLPAAFVSGLTQVTAVGADHFMIFDATDSALKKSLVSDVLESATSISTSADATAITIDSNEKVTFTSDVTTGGHLSVGGNNNELRFYEGSNYVGFEAPALSADKIWVLPAADGSSGQVISTDGSGNLSFSTVSGTTINNNADNRIITGSGTANTLNGESGLTYDGLHLGMTSNHADHPSDANVLQLGGNAVIQGKTATGAGKSFRIMQNVYDDASAGLSYISTDEASHYTQVNGTHSFNVAASGSADAAISFTEAMKIDVAGNVGINETSPDFSGFGSNGGGLELDDVGSSFTAVRVNQGGTGDFYLAVTTGAAYLWGKANSPTVFGTNNAEKMRLDESGSLGLGTNNPGSLLHVAHSNGGANPTARIENTTGTVATNSVLLDLKFSGDDSFSNCDYLRFQDSSGEEGVITGDGGGRVYYEINSDYRLKENVLNYSGGLNKIKALSVKRYNYKTRPGTTYTGFLAHEVAEVVDGVARGTKDAVNPDGTPDYQGMDLSKLVPELVSAIQEQQTIIDDLKSRIETLEG